MNSGPRSTHLGDEYPTSQLAMSEHPELSSVTLRQQAYKRRRKLGLRLLVGLSAVSICPLTYLATVHNWVPLPMGRVYLEAQHQETIAEMSDAARLEGRELGYDLGHQLGRAEGTEIGYRNGLEHGYQDGSSEGYESGYDDGLSDGNMDGFSDGYTAGCELLFDGLNTDRVGDWWDYYYGPSYASYYQRSVCDWGF